MKKLVGVAVVVLLVIGIVKVVNGRGAHAQAHEACENVIEQCGPFMETQASDLDDCTEAFVDGRNELGDKYGQQYDEMTSCITDAGSCGEVVGCMTGAIAVEIEKQMDGFGRGFDKMTRDR